MSRRRLLALALVAGCHSSNPAFETHAGLDAAVPVDAAADHLAEAPSGANMDPDTAPDIAPALTPEAPAPGPDLLNGLVGYWPMDDVAGAMATDRSGRGHHGTLEGVDPATAWVTGHIGGGLLLDQNQGAGVSVRPTALLDRIQRFTIAAWVYREQVPRFASVLSREIPGTNSDVYGLTFSNNDLSIYLPPAPGLTTTLRSPVPFPVGQWVHAAATYDGETLSVYQGGVLRASLGVRVVLPASDAPLYIGTNKNSIQAPEPLHGRVDEVVMYDRALAASEIAALAGGMRPVAN